MTFYLKEEFLSFDHFDIWDEQDQLVYSAVSYTHLTLPTNSLV